MLLMFNNGCTLNRIVKHLNISLLFFLPFSKTCSYFLLHVWFHYSANLHPVSIPPLADLNDTGTVADSNKGGNFMAHHITNFKMTKIMFINVLHMLDLHHNLLSVLARRSAFPI